METYSLFLWELIQRRRRVSHLRTMKYIFAPILAFGAMMDLQNTAQATTNFCVKNPLKTLLQAQLHGCIA